MRECICEVSFATEVYVDGTLRDVNRIEELKEPVVRCRNCKRAHFQWHDYYDESPECFTPDPTDFAHEGRIHQPIVHDPIPTTKGGIN